MKKFQPNIDEFIEVVNENSIRGLRDFLIFWRDNNCVSCEGFERRYKRYCKGKWFRTYHNLCHFEIKSSIPFKITLMSIGTLCDGIRMFTIDTQNLDGS